VGRGRKKEMRSLVIGIALAVLTFAGVQNASAQIIDTVDFTTSFSFTVGNTTLPAGSYSIRPDDDDPRILELRGKNTSALFQVDLVEGPKIADKTEVVFSRHGNSYVLKNIWVVGSNSGVETTPVEAERHAAKDSGAKSEHRLDAKKKSGNAGGQ